MWHMGNGRQIYTQYSRQPEAHGAYATISSPGTLSAGQRNGGHEELRVRMVGLLDHEFHVAGLDHSTAIQHDDIVADLIGRRQIMGNVDEGNTVFQVHGAQRAKNGGAEGRVHHRHRFVCHNEARAQEQGPCYHHPLALPTAQLVREAAQGLFRAQPNGLQHRGDQGARCGLGGGEFELGHGCGQNMVDPIERVIHFVGVLEDHLYIAAKGAPRCV